MTRYGYSVEETKCLSFEFSGCGGNENNFGTYEECQVMCEDPCSEEPDPGMEETVFTMDGESVEVSCDR